jgi:hypothetical protein
MGMHIGIQLGSQRKITKDVHMRRPTVPNCSGIFFLRELIYDAAGNSGSLASNSRTTHERRTGHRYETTHSWPSREKTKENHDKPR